ncbi:serine-rich adhesin for platelets [Calliphora vicina]|uniref:serine-rich adhesin for platelets n=1 Tax=Calliphora vicina TaxID=7373 RepID=UPI00325B08C8
MKSGTSYWNISFVIHNLLTFALVIGLQNHFLYTITKTVTVVAVALPQTQAVVGATAALVESLQFNAFDTTRTTFASSPSSSSSWSSPYLPSSSSSFQEAGAVQQKFSSPSLTSAIAYPTSTITTTMSGFHNTKTSRIMGNSINSISPTTQTINMMHTTFKTRGSSRTTSASSSSSSSGDSGISGNSIGTKLLGKQQNSLSSYPPTTSSGSGISSGAGAGLSSFKNVKKSKSTITASNSDTSRSQSSSIYNNDQQQHQDHQQHFPLDFTFSKNHWTNSDAALNGGVDAGIGGTSSGVVGNFRLASLSSVTSSSSSSISAFSSSSSSSSATETERPRIFRNKHHHERHWGPFFEEPLNSTTSGDNSITTAHLYTEAVLNCRVGMLKDKTVMWVRRTSEKVSLLTVGNVTYSSDPRIRVKFQYPNNWRLLINPTQWDDAGIYMCQVSTHPPRVFTTNLTVIEPPLRLIDDQERDVGDRYYKTGSTIDLQCQVSRSFLYKEKQNILKSLKPLNVHNDSNTTSSNNSSTTASSSSFRGTSSSSSSSSGGTGSNTLNPGYSNNNNKNQTKMTANKNSNNKHVSPATNINGISSPSSSATTTTGFGSFNNDLLQNTNQSATSADKQGIALEQQFSNLVFWSKDDEELPSSALKRISSNDKWLTSRVTITDAKLTDSGNYSCSIGRLFTAIVQVQVLTGELPAAVQHNSAAAVVVCTISIRELIQLYWIYVTAAYFVVN